MKNLWFIFLTIFLAELGDKTQLATMLFAVDPAVSRFHVFLASSVALVLSSLLAVLIGAQLSNVISLRLLKILAGFGFILIGVWVLLDARSS